MIKKLTLGLAGLLFAIKAFAQHERLDFVTDSLLKEGKRMYRSEWASWYGTDAFMARCPNKRALSGGYFSYETNDNLVNIFFSKDVDPVVIASISFVKDFNADNYKLDTIQRPFNRAEQKYYAIRKQALNRINSDTTFKYYKNTTLNLVPIIDKRTKRVTC